MTAPTGRRGAALIATAVAVPVMVVIVVVSVLTFGRSAADPAASPSAPAVVGPVTMAAPALDEATATLCRAVIAHLPDTLAGLARRPVSAGPEQNAAYGDPPVTLSCGVAPPTVGLTDMVYPLSGVCWIPTGSSADGVAWSTVDRIVTVRVVVPGPTDGSGQFVNAFSATVAADDPLSDGAPTGCH